MLPDDRPPLRSFKPRRRRLGERARADYESNAEWRIDETGPVLDLDEVFARAAPRMLEIGFGRGEALLELAERAPERNLIGVEVHQPGIAVVLGEIDRRGLTNVRVVEGDALVFLARIAPASLDEIRIWFPDPWPKVRQHKKRIVRPDVVTELVARLTIGGRLCLATDWDDYASQMAAVAAAEPMLFGGPVDRPVRPRTRFEGRAVADGRAVVDFEYVRSSGFPPGGRG